MDPRGSRRHALEAVGAARRRRRRRATQLRGAASRGRLDRTSAGKQDDVTDEIINAKGGRNCGRVCGRGCSGPAKWATRGEQGVELNARRAGRGVMAEKGRRPIRGAFRPRGGAGVGLCDRPRLGTPAEGGDREQSLMRGCAGPGAGRRASREAAVERRDP